ncbi:MAG TPA: hypothetical protein ENN67_08995, partial [Firmicutes bacterium]|nr:hypothetical protein [Bacillota bacterium]
MPDLYYVRVYTSDDTFPAPYLLEFTENFVDVTPKNIVNITPDGWYVDPQNGYWDDNYLYLTGIGGFWVYEMSNPAVPILVRQEKWYIYGDSCKYGDYIYYTYKISDDESSVCMIDVSDPESPVLHENVVYFPFNINHSITMNSEHFYIFHHASYPSGNLYIYEWASDPENPVIAGGFTLSASGGLIDLELRDPEGGQTTLMLGFNNQIFAYNVENPASPYSTASFPYFNARSFKVNGDYLYFIGYKDGTTPAIFVLAYLQSIGFGLKSM